MSEDVREAYLAIGSEICSADDFQRIWQAATASSEAKWRGLVEKLADDALRCHDMIRAGLREEALEAVVDIRQALTEAAKMLGRHKVYQCTVCGCDLLDGRGKFLGDRQCNKHLPPV